MKAVGAAAAEELLRVELRRCFFECPLGDLRAWPATQVHGGNDPDEYGNCDLHV